MRTATRTVFAEGRLFFSSRRRHTMSLCDWSSDVCSSDLINDPESRTLLQGLGLDLVFVIGWSQILAPETLRSEERRVGKECRKRLFARHCLHLNSGKSKTTSQNNVQNHIRVVSRVSDVY